MGTLNVAYYLGWDYFLFKILNFTLYLAWGRGGELFFFLCVCVGGGGGGGEGEVAPFAIIIFYYFFLFGVGERSLSKQHFLGLSNSNSQILGVFIWSIKRIGIRIFC